MYKGAFNWIFAANAELCIESCTPSGIGSIIYILPISVLVRKFRLSMNAQDIIIGK